MRAEMVCLRLAKKDFIGLPTNTRRRRRVLGRRERKKGQFARYVFSDGEKLLLGGHDATDRLGELRKEQCVYIFPGL